MAGLRDVVVLSASFEGVRSLCALIEKLPVPFTAPIIATLHVYPHPVHEILARLARCTSMTIHLGTDGTVARPSSLYIAPADLHLVFASPDGLLRVRARAPVERASPADALFASAARFCGQRVIGVILAGGGTSGLAGLQAIDRAGGIGIFEQTDDGRQAKHPLVDMGDVYVLALEDIAGLLSRLVEGDPPEP